jgi:hypothetical protein
MSLLDDASLIVTPNAEKAGKLYSIIPTNGNGDFTVTRATTATRVNSSGLIESVPINEPRLDYSLGSCPNILLEPQRTNLALRSEEFDNASWTKATVNVTANYSIAPNGTTTAERIVPTGGNVSGYVNRVYQPINTILGTTYTFSVWAKSSASTPKMTLSILNTGGQVFSITNQWVRYSVQLTGTGGIANFNIYAGDVTFSTGVTNSNNEIEVWGAQIEAGAYATSYIPTSSASVTRNADVISRGNIFTNGLITASGGTWFVDLRNNVVQNSGYVQAQTFGLGSGVVGASANNFWLQGINGQRISVWKQVAGSASVIRITAANNCKLAIKWNGTTADVFENGVKVVAATAFTATALEDLRTFVTTNTYYINSMALFPTPLTDTQCIALTT